MKRSLILTIIGKDEPGLVEMVATTLAKHHANWHQSNLSKLAGKFAGILVATLDEDHIQPLKKALAGLEARGLKVIVEDGLEEVADREGLAISLDLIGHDKPGIVSQISHTLAARGISVDRLETALVSGSMSGEELFKVEADLRVPADLDMDLLQDDLEAIAADLMVDISLNK